MTTDDRRRQELRERAERFLEENPLFRRRYTAEDLQDLIEEIHIYQAELEVQNEELRVAQQQLIESRDRYYDLYDFAPVGYCSIDLNGHIVEINLAAAEMLGKPRASLVKHSLVRYIAGKNSHALVAAYGRAMRDKNCHECEVAIPVDGEEHPRIVRIGVTARRKSAEGLVGFRVCMTDISELAEHQCELERMNRELEDRVLERTAELEHKNRQLKKLTAELLRSEQTERHRLAADLHDHLAQLLVVTAMRAEAADRAPSLDAMRGALADIKRMLHEAKQFTRTLITDLSPSVLFDKGLGAAMRHLARGMQEHGLRVEVRDRHHVEVPRELAILIHQSVRELLFNILKHAGVGEAAVELDSVDDTLRVVVADRGAGFDTADLAGEVDDSSSFGLASIRQRIDAMSGSCRIESEPGQGTRVELRVPIRVEAANEDLPAQRPARVETAVSVLVVDDHQAVRAGLRRLLEEQPTIHVVGEAEDGIEAVEKARALHPNAVVMDINMPRMGGIDATRAITSEFSDITVIGFSIREDDDARTAMADAGAKAFFTKGSPVRELCEVLIAHCV